jgi:hypothetical protein
VVCEGRKSRFDLLTHNESASIRVGGEWFEADMLAMGRTFGLWIVRFLSGPKATQIQTVTVSDIEWHPTATDAEAGHVV